MSAERTSAEQLAFSKEKEAPGDALVGNQFFTIGRWWAGVWDKSWNATRIDDSRRLTVDGERVKVNFLIFYEIDQQTVKTVLRLDDYDSEWVLLASLEPSTPQSQ